jgi:protease I
MKLKGKTAALLVEDIYNEFEVWIPYYRLKEEGVVVTVVGSGTASLYHGKLGIPVHVDKNAADVKASDFDAVIIPGGYAPDKMRLHPEMVGLVRDAFNLGKVVACICHGGWMLASAGILKGLGDGPRRESHHVPKTGGSPGLLQNLGPSHAGDVDRFEEPRGL